MATCLRQFSGKKMPWWNRANLMENGVILMEKATQHTYGQPGSMEYILRSQVVKSQGGMVKMAPGTAKRILEELNFQGQRKVESGRVYGHAYAIRTGEWMDDYPIHFAALPDGRIWLVDGQHRLSAISEQQSPVGVVIRLVEVDSEKEARKFYSGFDQKQSTRTNTQIIAAVDIAKDIGLSNRMTRAVFEAAPLLLNNLEVLHGSASVKSNPEFFLQQARMKVVTDWANEAKTYSGITEVARRGLYERLKKTGPVAVGLYTLRYQLAKAKEFWTGVANDDGLRKGDPRKTLINDLEERGLRTGSVRQRVQQSSLAWNAFCEGRDLKVIKCVTDAPIVLWGTPLKAMRK
jgi:hypothetical protein